MGPYMLEFQLHTPGTTTLSNASTTTTVLHSSSTLLPCRDVNHKFGYAWNSQLQVLSTTQLDWETGLASLQETVKKISSCDQITIVKQLEIVGDLMRWGLRFSTGFAKSKQRAKNREEIIDFKYVPSHQLYRHTRVTMASTYMDPRTAYLRCQEL